MVKSDHKILIAEDDLDLLEVLRKKFTIEKFDVLQAPNGKIGLEQAFGNHPDMIADVVKKVKSKLK